MRVATRKYLAKCSVFVHLRVSNDGFRGEEEADGLAEVSDHEGDDQSAFEPADVPARFREPGALHGRLPLAQMCAEVLNDTPCEFAPTEYANHVARSEQERPWAAQYRQRHLPHVRHAAGGRPPHRHRRAQCELADEPKQEVSSVG